MAFRGGDSLGFLVWLLLLQTRLGEAWVVPGTLSLSPLPSEDGLNDPGISPQERPLSGMPETSVAPEPGGSIMPLDSVTFAPGQFSTMPLSRKPSPTWIPAASGEVSGPWPSAENCPEPMGLGL